MGNVLVPTTCPLCGGGITVKVRPEQVAELRKAANATSPAQRPAQRAPRKVRAR